MSADVIGPGFLPLERLAEVSGGVALGGGAPGGSVELPYLRVANVQDGYIDTEDVKTVRVAVGAIERFRLARGDVLLTEGGDLDKLGRGAVWDGRVDPCLHQNHIFKVRCDRTKLLPEFLALYMASGEGKSYFLRVAKQTTNLASISASQVKSMPVPAHPLAVQYRVVEAVDAVKAQERAIEASIAKLRSVRQGILEAFMDRLAQGEIAVDWLPVRDVGDVRMGKQLSPDSRAAGGQFPYLRVANVLAGHIDYADVKSMGFTSGERSTYQLQPGDILLNEGQSLELVGRSAIYRRAAGEFCFQNTLVRFRAGDGLDPEYAQVVFAYWLQVGVFAAIAKKTTSIAHLGGDRFGALDFPLVSSKEQADLVSTIGACDESIASEQGELRSLRLLKQGLVDDLLSGEA